MTDKIFYRRSDSPGGPWSVGYVITQNGTMICIGAYRGERKEYGSWWERKDLEIKEYKE